MDMFVPLIAVPVAALGIIWHRQHINDKLGDDFNTATREQREATRKLGGVVAENSQIVVTRVGLTPADAVRNRLAELGLCEADTAEAVPWARRG